MTQTVHANGINISYEVAGEGPWLLFSHSLGCSKAMWQSQFELLAESFQVVRYDTRGHGQTDAPAGPYSLDLLADDVKALCDALGIEQCHFVGLSMGGMIGQTVALKYPELLLSLTLADTSIQTAIVTIIRFSVSETKPSGTLLSPPAQAHLISRRSMYTALKTDTAPIPPIKSATGIDNHGSAPATINRPAPASANG